MYKKINTPKTPQQALQSLVRLCAKAERSSGDALRLMGRWQVEPAHRREVLEKLVSMRFIDDRRFAAAYVKDKLRFNGWGKRKIRAGLVAKGISGDIIEDVLGETENDTGRLQKLLAAKMKSVKASSPYELKMKLVRFGMGRGFDYHEVEECIESMVKTDENDEY